MSLIVALWSFGSSAVDSIEVELDPYYSNVGYFKSLTDKPIPRIDIEDETNLYNVMLQSLSAEPRFFLIEASINPLPALGAYVKSNHENLYDEAQLSHDLNIIQALTEGFEEPYALSFFFGSVLQFVRPGEDARVSNKGYAGYLISVGDQHLIGNEMVYDPWLEVEMKIKGDQDFEDRTLSWSARTGIKLHENDDIKDVVYFAIRRNHLDTTISDGGFLDNNDIEYTLEFDKNNLELVQQELFVDKKWNLGYGDKTAFSFGIGFILEKGKYTGALAQETTDLRLIFRPSLQF